MHAVFRVWECGHASYPRGCHLRRGRRLRPYRRRTTVLVNNVTFDGSVGGAVPASVPPPGISSIPSPIALHGSSYGMPPRPSPGPGRCCHRKTTTTRSTLRQRFALACFRYATIAFLSIFESNAASVLDECDWSGITCNANGRVATLVCVLPNQAPGLGGSLPRELYFFGPTGPQ